MFEKLVKEEKIYDYVKIFRVNGILNVEQVFFTLTILHLSKAEHSHPLPVIQSTAQ